MSHWLQYPVSSALWILAAGVFVPLILGGIAWLFYRRDDDDVRMHPEYHVAELRAHQRGPVTPEPEHQAYVPWPDFPPTPRA